MIILFVVARGDFIIKLFTLNLWYYIFVACAEHPAT
eukprot:UN21966